jgi:microcystin-dependent protein
LSVGATTLSTDQIPSHTHSAAAVGSTDLQNSGAPTGFVGATGGSTGSTGGGNSHTHALSGSATFTGNAINLAVKYVDVIRATKD